MKKPVVWVGLVVGITFMVMLVKFPPKGSPDAAGWFQAFGAIAAIGLAVWLQYDGTRQRKRQAIQVAAVFAGQLLNSLDALQLFCRNEQWGEFTAGREILQDALTVQVPIGELNGDFVAMVYTLRGIGIKALSDSAGRTVQASWRQFDIYFGNAGLDCRNAMKKAGLKPAEKAHTP